MPSQRCSPGRNRLHPVLIFVAVLVVMEGSCRGVRQQSQTTARAEPAGLRGLKDGNGNGMNPLYNPQIQIPFQTYKRLPGQAGA